MSDRPVATDALATLGTIIGENEKRDAIHIAVENVVAKQLLKSGDHVTAEGRLVNPKDAAAVGIVDPFLSVLVQPGERFWLLIYPRKINSLRHVWSHPAFPDEQSVEAPVDSKTASEAWLRSYISTADCPGYEATIGAAVQAAEDGDEYVFFSGRDAHGDIPPEFWDHLEVVTGRKFTHRPEGFSCSC